MTASIDLDSNHRLLVTHQAAEEISQNFYQAILPRQQLLTISSLVILADAGAPIDPGAADVPAHAARCNTDPGIVANALHLAGASFGIDIENGDAGRAV